MGVAYMSCGHFFSRIGMRQLITRQLQEKQSCYIQCPVMKNGIPCKAEWKTKEWRLVGGYPKSQFQNIMNRLSQNYVNKNKKNPQ